MRLSYQGCDLVGLGTPHRRLTSNKSPHWSSHSVSAWLVARHPREVACPVITVSNNAAGPLAGWHVRASRDEGAQIIPMRTLLQYGVDIVRLSEVCLPDSVHRVIIVPEIISVYQVYHGAPGECESELHQLPRHKYHSSSRQDLHGTNQKEISPPVLFSGFWP